jgi:hypothetical protein
MGSFDCANWLHKAEELPIQQFKDEVQKYLTGDSEPSELIFFNLYRSQVPVIEQALEMAGSDLPPYYVPPRMKFSDRN